MKDFITSEIINEKAVLVGLITPEQSEEKVTEYLDELAFLAETAGLVPDKRFVQKLDMANSVTFVGSGKLNEIRDFVTDEDNEIGVVIFDDELSARQIRNIERELKLRILDRTSLILDIFAMRAQTAHSKVQVELAQYQYLLPRLTRLWSHLDRQRGGGGGAGGAIMRGPGETQLETDRRIILDKIARLKVQLQSIDKQMSVQRRNRGKLVRLALVGYTNVGKSTLDEVREADILIHVVDISHPAFEEHIEVVEKTLFEIDKEEKPTIVVFNKIDAFSYVEKDEFDLTPKTRQNISLDELKSSWMSKLKDNCIFISARERTNIDELKELIYEKAKEIHIQRFPYNDFLFQDYEEE